MTTTTTPLDTARIEQFAGEIFGLYTGGMFIFHDRHRLSHGFVRRGRGGARDQ